jgi:hypothetical protein
LQLAIGISESNAAAAILPCCIFAIMQPAATTKWQKYA